MYDRLKAVREGKSKRYGTFTTDQMRLLSDDDLKGLATSWGPFQIMGYHCIPMGIEIKQLQGNKAVLYGIQWADKSYGKYLRNRDFENAFHIHNTGRPLPQSGKTFTHDPDYIKNGLAIIGKIRDNNL